jgi:hypothetical protein
MTRTLAERMASRKAALKRYYIKNREKILAYGHAYRLEHPAISTKRQHENGSRRPLSEAKDCAQYLGVYIAERALSNFFDNIQRMPANNPGYDFICGKGFKIDAKSSCIRIRKRYTPHWQFKIMKNEIADYFILLAFDNRESLEPQHVWLIPGNVINHLTGVTIHNTQKGLAKYAQYEKPLDKVYSCCAKIREST